MHKVVDKILGRIGLVRTATLYSTLRSEAGIAKRIDEHREVVEAIASHTTFLQDCPWHTEHLESQDRFLTGLIDIAGPAEAHRLKNIRDWPQLDLQPWPPIDKEAVSRI